MASVANRFTLPAIRRCDALTLAASVIGPFCLYVCTLPRTVVLEDDGLFLMAASHLGIAHPPGYPLHTLLSHLFTYLPFGTPAFTGHLSSAVFGALACGMVYLCGRLLRVGWLPALAAAWMFAASEHVWSQAIITETYTLNALFLFATYALILHGIRHPEQSGIWVAAASVYGMSLANHWPLMVLAFPGLFLATLPVRRKLLPKLPLLVAVSFSVAALPYVWMVLRSWSEPLISFYGSIANWEEFWFYISRSGYSKVDASAAAGWLDRLAYLRWFGMQLFWQLTPPGCLLALLGLTVMARQRLSEATSSGFVFLGNSLALLLLIAFEFDAFHVAVFRTYSLVCYGMAALWLAVGLEFLLGCARTQASTERRSRIVTVLAKMAVAGMVVFLVQMNWRMNDRSTSDFAQRYSDMIFNLLPRNAVMFVYSDMGTGPLGYYRFVERHRTDVTLLNLHGLVYGKRLFDPLLPKERKAERLWEFIDETERTVFFTADSDSAFEFPKHYGIRHHGFVQELVRGAKPGTVQLASDAAGEHYFEYLVDLEPIDVWERTRRNELLHSYGNLLGYVVLSDHPVLLGRMQHTLELANREVYSLIGMAGVLLKHGGDSHLAQAETWLGEAQRLQGEFTTKKWRGYFLYMQGFLQVRLGDRDAARALFRKSRIIYPHPDNASIEAIKNLAR